MEFRRVLFRSSLIWTDIVDLAPMPSFVRGRVVLLGDAAHAVTPDLGQGAGLAIEDAAVISALLGRHSLAPAVREYDARRNRTSVGKGKVVSDRVDLGGRRKIKKKKQRKK